MKKKISILLTTATLLLPSWAGAELLEPKQPISTRFETNLAERHDRGAYLRLSLGAGYASWWSSNFGTQGGNIGVGVGLSGQLALGWLPWERVALHIGIWGITGYRLTLVGAGPGITYWFSDDSPWYLSMMVGPTTTGSSSIYTPTDQWGVGAETEIGLMSWIGDHSMLGMSLVAGGEGFDLDGDGTHIAGWRVGLRLTTAFE